MIMVTYSRSSSLVGVVVVFLGHKTYYCSNVFNQVLIDRVMQDMAIDNCFHVSNQISLKVTIFTDTFI